MPTLYLAIDSTGMKSGADQATQHLVRIEVEIDQTDKAAKKAERSLADMFKAAARGALGVAKGFRDAAVQIALWGRNATLAGAAFIALDVRTAQHIDRQSDLAKALGLTVQQLSLLEFASDRAGTNIGEISQSIRAVASQAQQFKAGSQGAIDLFSSLGVDPTGKSQIQLIQEVATGIDRMTDSADKLAISQDLLGRSGFKVVELFRNQGQGLRDIEADAKRFGAVVDNDLAQKGADLADAWGNFKTSLQSVANEILRGSGPSITRFLNSIGEDLASSRFKVSAFFDALGKSFDTLRELYSSGGFGKNASEFARLFATGIKTIFTNALPAAVASAGTFGVVLGAAIIDGLLGSLGERIAQASQIINRTLGSILPAGFAKDFFLNAESENLALMRNAMKTNYTSEAMTAAPKAIANAWAEAAAGMSKDLSGAYDQFLQNADDQTKEKVKAIIGYFQAIDDNALKLKQAADHSGPFYDQGNVPTSGPSASKQVIRDLLGMIEAKRREAEAISMTSAEREKSLGLYALEDKAIGLSTNQLETFKRAYAAVFDEIEAASRRKDLADSISDPIARGVEEAILHFESLRDVARSVYEDIARAGIQTFLTGPLKSALSGGLQGLFGGVGLFNKYGNAFSGGSVVPFASGGVVTGPTIFPMRSGMGLMGEAGPEAVMPLRRTSSGRLGVETTGGNGGVTMQMNVYLSGGARQQDADRVGRSVRQAIDDANRALVRGRR